MLHFAARHRRSRVENGEPSLSVIRHRVPCASCGGPAVAAVAFVRQGGRLVAEELEARCWRCGLRA
jgi:hypothetical protein